MENNNTQMVITDQAKFYLFETAKWTKFLAIVGFIFMGLMVLLGLFMSAIMKAMMIPMGIPVALGGTMSVIYGVMFFVFAAIYVYPLYCLLKFSVRTRAAILSNDTPTMTESFGWLKKFYQYIGILLIIALAFYALSLVIGIISVVAML